MNTTLFFYLVHPLVALFASVGYAIVCNAPRKEIPYCGLTAFLCWLVYQLVLRHDGNLCRNRLCALSFLPPHAPDDCLSYPRHPAFGTRCGGLSLHHLCHGKPRAGNNRKYSDCAKAGRCHRHRLCYHSGSAAGMVLFLPQIKEKKQLSRILSNERRNALWIMIRSLSISLWMQAKSC